ncbi:hypothetical protein [Actinoplanes friuliensis]|jgi:hypothetical protein|uniref:Uncharacterized protein n=1 Tax=Actinoplanes friuliensis DSM 7358 TaxID=1246995 RepID=U5W5L2_9ACTN|nr:hypothetical protein [Actinoplanes friuliensis]AGZ43275.1 hypothetical protein AFR_25045 [Actinoplanes friuliensis DSM 7358]
MFRLIQLQAQHGVPRIGIDPDGYGSERAALARYRETPDTFSGIGRFDPAGRLAEIIMDTVCGPPGDCPDPAVVVNAVTFQRLCDNHSFGLEVLTLPELALHLGVVVRMAPAMARSGRHAAPDESHSASNRIAREFSAHVDDPVWRMELCAELARTPAAVNGLLIGVGALSHRDVLDLYPALCALGTQLPGGVHADLVRATVRPLSPAGVTALRLGL